MARLCHVAMVRSLAGIVLAFMLQGCSNATAPTATPSAPTTTTIDVATGYFNDVVRQALEEAKDTKINPLIAANMPDPLPVNLNVNGTAHPGCGMCSCPPTADYTILLKQVDGLSSLHVSEFKTVEINGNQFECLVNGCDALVIADVEEDDVTIPNGTVDVHVNTCGVKEHTEGTVTTHMDTLATLTLNLRMKPDLDNDCVQISVTQVDILFEKVTFHNTKANVNVAGIDLDVSFIVDALVKAAPDLGKNLANSIRSQLATAITAAATQIPCVKIPDQSVEVV